MAAGVVLGLIVLVGVGTVVVLQNRGKGQPPAPAIAAAAPEENPAPASAPVATAGSDETATVRPTMTAVPRPKLPPSTVTASAAFSGEQIYQRLLNSTVFILSAEKDGIGRQFISAGSGSLLNKERRLVVTNYHVVGDRDRVLTFFPVHDDKKELITQPSHYVDNLERIGIRARVVVRNATLDLAVLELDRVPPDAVALPLATTYANPGAQVYSVGASGIELRDFSGSLWRLSVGSVRGRYKDSITFKSGQSVSAMFLETQKPINSGDSGGPTVNDRGELVGVVSASNPRGDLIKLDIDLTEVRGFLTQYASREGWKWKDAVASAPARSPAAAAVLDTLIAVLKDGEQTDRISAARRIGELGESARGVVPSLLASVENADAELADAIETALTRIGPPPEGGESALIRSLASKSPAARLYAARTFAQSKSLPADAVEPLVRAFEDSSAGVRAAAIRAVILAGPGARATALAAAFDRLGDADESVRVAALALVAVYRPFGEPDKAFLLKKLAHADARVRLVAADEFSPLIDDAAEALRVWRTVLRDTSPPLRAVALRGLSKYPDTVATVSGDLLKLIEDDDSTVQLAAIEAAVHAKSFPGIIDGIANAFRKTSRPNVRGAAAASLAQLVEARAEQIPLLRELYKNGSTEAKRVCLARFGELAANREAVTDDLALGLREADKELRVAALHALRAAPESASSLVKAIRGVAERAGEEADVVAACVAALAGAGREGFHVLTDLTALNLSKPVVVELGKEFTKAGERGRVVQAWLFRQAEEHEEIRDLLTAYLPKHADANTVRELLPRTDFYRSARPGEKPKVNPPAVRKWAVATLGELNYDKLASDAAAARLRVLADRKDDAEVRAIAEVALRKMGRGK